MSCLYKADFLTAIGRGWHLAFGGTSALGARQVLPRCELMGLSVCFGPDAVDSIFKGP